MSTPSISIDVTDTTGALAALEHEWNTLWKETGATPFQAPAWLIPWWQTYGAGALRLIVCREGHDLIGLAPMFIVQRAAGGPRELQLLGTGNTDYLDVIFRTGYESECTAAVARVLVERDGWDVCDLRNLRPSSPLMALGVPGGYRVSTMYESPCPVLDMSIPLAPALTRDIAYGRRRASREGGLTVRHATAETVGADLDVLFALHAARWRQRDQRGVLHDAATRAFHRAAAARMARESMLQLITVWIGDAPAAAHYGFVHAGRAYYYLGGFDVAYSRLNAGKLAIAAALDDARERQAQWFDFLGGNEPYKYEWGSADQPRHRRMVRR